MASERLFSTYPPFPNSVSIATIPQISLAKLLDNDPAEIQQVFIACRKVGFFSLDLNQEHIGRRLLEDIEDLFKITEEVMALSFEEKKKYIIKPPAVLTGCVLC